MATLSFLLAVPLAWAVSRTDIPGKRFIRFSALAAFICPPYLMAIGWILLAGPNAGFINQIWGTITGSGQPLINVFSFLGLVLAMSSNLFYFLFVFTVTALDSVSSEIEDAASILGASQWKTAIKITVPLIMPALLGGLSVIFLLSIALLGVPVLISFPARYPVVTTQLLEFFQVPLQVGVAAAYCVPLLGITLTVHVFQKLLTRRRSFVSLTGKGGQRRILRLGRARPLVAGYAFAVCGVMVVLPYLALLQASMSRSWAQGPTRENLTFRNFITLCEDEGVYHAIVNSFLYAGISAVVVAVIAAVAAYLAARRLVAAPDLLSFLCMAPFVIPGVILGIGFYTAYAGPPLSIYGTGTLLILAFCSRFLPIMFSACVSSIASIHPEMEEAARLLGATRLRVIWSIVAPLFRKGMIAAGILVFILASHELSMAIFLVGPQSRVVSVMMLDLSEGGNLELLSALGVGLMVLTVALAALGMRLEGRDFLAERKS